MKTTICRILFRKRQNKAGKCARYISCLTAFVILFPLHRAAAQVDPWEFEVYPYATVGRGIYEAELLNAVVLNGHHEGENGTAKGIFPSEHLWYSSLEFTYGLTDRIEAAAYVNFAHPDGHDLWYAGSKFRLRGRLFDEDVLPVNLGWYAELDSHRTPQFDDQDLELELRPIVEKDLGPVAILLNPLFEKPFSSEGWEFGYVAGLYYRLNRWCSPGLEFYGGLGPIDNNEPLSEQQHYIFPVLRGELPGGLEYNIGTGFGLTSGSDNLILKFNLEFEKFIGSLFGPSGDKAWLW